MSTEQDYYIFKTAPNNLLKEKGESNLILAALEELSKKMDQFSDRLGAQLQEIKAECDPKTRELERETKRQEKTCVYKPSHVQTMSIPYEISHVQEEQQLKDDSPHIALVKSPSKYQVEPIQEEHNQPLILNNNTGLSADLNVLSIEPKEENMMSVSLARKEEEEPPMIEANQRDTMRSSTMPQFEVVQENCKQPLNSCDQVQLFAVLHVHDVPNQEREDRVQRRHDDAQGTRQQAYTRHSCLESLYRKYVYSFFIVLIDQNVHARSGLQLLIYDLRFEVESCQEREIDAGARGPTPILRQAHVYPLFMDQATYRKVIKKQVLESIGLDYELLIMRDDKAHEKRPEEITLIKWIDQDEQGLEDTRPMCTSPRP